MNYDDDIWQEGQDDECVNCGRSGQTCDCDSEAAFEESPTTSTYPIESGEDFIMFKGEDNSLRWHYLYNENGLIAHGTIVYNIESQEYEVNVSITNHPSMETVIEYKVGEFFENSDLS